MSAEAYGARLLAEVHEESLASFLSGLRVQHDRNPAPAIITGFPQLDKILDQLQPRNQTTIYSDDFVFDGEQDQDPSSDGLLPSANVNYEKRKPVSLHVSNYANTCPIATTSFLHKLLSLSVLSPSTEGKGGVAVFVDCSGSFQPALLYEFLVEHLKKHKEADGEELATDSGDLSEHNILTDLSPNKDELTSKQQDIVSKENAILSHSPGNAGQHTDNETENSEHEHVQKVKQATDTADQHEFAACKLMDHIHVLECNSSASLLEALKALPKYLLDIGTHRSGDRVLNLIYISGIDSFYWTERDASETARLEGSQSHMNASRSEPVSSQILKELKTLQVRLQCPLVAYSTSQIPLLTGDDDLHSDLPQTSDASALFNNYIHSSLLTLQPFHNLGPGTLFYNNDKAARKKAQQTEASVTRSYGFKLHIGGAVPPQLRGSIGQSFLDGANLRVHLEKGSNFVFDM